jgi:predicted DNA-binding transcriptional regulator
MGNEKKELQKAFSLKEKHENLLTNLENLKNGGTLSEEQYNSIKIGYVTSLTEAKTAIEQIKMSIAHNIQAEEQNYQMLDMELKNISVRFKTGEMKVEETQEPGADTKKDPAE